MTMLSFVLVNIFLLLAPCIHGPGGVAASSVTFYSDTGCTTLIANTTAQDGFPDGQCTNLTASVNQTFASFLISSLDEGCSATVYGPLTTEESCSGTAVAAELGTCYNTTWVDYSVDECTAAGTNGTGSATGNASGSTSAATAVAPSSTGGNSGGTSLNVQAGGITVGMAMLVGLVLLAL